MSIKIKVTFSFREDIFFLARGKKELEKFHGIIRQAPLSMEFSRHVTIQVITPEMK